MDRCRRMVMVAVVAVAAVATPGCGADDATPTADTVSDTTADTAADTTVGTTTDTTAEPMWTAAAPLQRPRSSHGVVAVDGALYAVGGTGEDGTPLAEVERFDGTAWTDVTVLPGDGVNAPSVAGLDGRIYVIGGFQGRSGRPTDEVHVYDVATASWTTAAPLPTASGGHAAVVMEGRIHVIGGGTSRGTIADHVVYDPRTDTWSEAAPLPTTEGSPAAAVLAGELWAIGGRSGREDFGGVYLYDPAADAWSDGPAIDPRGTAGAVVACDTIFVVGGESQVSKEVLGDVFRLVGGAWVDQPRLPTARSFARAILFDDAIYVVGGSTEYGRSHASPGSSAVERFTPNC